MKKIIYSLLVIAVVASVAGVATYAGWNDTDTSVNNEIKAGSLELEWSVDGGTTWTTEAPTATQIATNAKPGDNGAISMLVRNAGNTVDGMFAIENVKFTETGELGQFVDISFQMERDSDKTWAGRTDNKLGIATNPRWIFEKVGVVEGVTLEKNGTAHEIKLNWTFVDKATGTHGALLNDTMGDSVFIDFSGVLTQK